MADRERSIKVEGRMPFHVAFAFKNTLTLVSGGFASTQACQARSTQQACRSRSTGDATPSPRAQSLVIARGCGLDFAFSSPARLA